MKSRSLLEVQQQFCKTKGVTCDPVEPLAMLGFARTTLGAVPINGLRHNNTGRTSGWFVWCGEDMSDAPDFFEPLCAEHAVQQLPAIGPLLGLPPGYRFLTDGEYVDIWFDESLLVYQS